MKGSEFKLMLKTGLNYLFCIFSCHLKFRKLSHAEEVSDSVKYVENVINKLGLFLES